MSEPQPKKRKSKTTNLELNPELSQKISDMIASLKDFPNPALVVGDGWAAMAAVGFLATLTKDAVVTDGVTPASNVLWILNSGAHAMAPLPFFESGVSAEGWKNLAHRLGVTSDEPQSGHYLREFRNRSFSRPPWHKSPTPEMRAETRMEWIWGPETRIAPIFESRFDMPLGELELKIREKISTLPNVRILSDVPVTGFEFSEEAGTESKVVLANGDKIAFARGIWADRWVGLGAIEGLPKGGALSRNREAVGILQGVFTHKSAMVKESMQEGFFCTTHKDAGEEFSRAVWGYFFDGGKKSVWTLFLTEEEGADNHSIGKKYRRLKQSLEKMFTGPEWLPEGAADFSATVENEQLLFHEDFIFANGDVMHEPQHLGKKNEQVPLAFITDAFGPSVAMEQAVRLFADEIGINLDQSSMSPLTTQAGTEAQDESTDPGSSSGEES